ncbi:MAG TPA: translation initiation factor IF-3 [Solirubrobacteraceae bacterium]|nr:translation initiation factor IF-3 [Solirubrobacteraceae bacterium]
MTRINERIRVPEVRLIDDEGNQIGVMKTPDALVFAQERELDLVEVAPEARPPVARVLDYSKYKYEQAQKQKQARKHQQQITIREIKFRPKIAQHDYDTKKNHVERFLRHKDKVKVTIMFRGREVTHPERGTAILDRLSQELAEYGVIEQHPTQEGRNMTMMMAPSKAVLSGRVDLPDGAADDAPETPGGADAAPEAAAGSEVAAAPAAPAMAAGDTTPPDDPAATDGVAATEDVASAPDAAADEPAPEATADEPAPAPESAADEPAPESAAANGEVKIAADGKAKPARGAAKKAASAGAPAEAGREADSAAGTRVS